MPPAPTSEPAARAAIVLAGGRGSRLGRDKPEVLVDGRRLLDIALDAVADSRIVLVGPPRTVDPRIVQVQEHPGGGGPAAAIATAIPTLGDLGPRTPVVLLAADLPGIRRLTIARLTTVLLTSVAPCDGVVLTDPQGRRQTLAGVWRLGALRHAVAARPDWNGVALRVLLAPLVVLEVAAGARDTADVDTPADLRTWERGADPAAG